MPPQLDGNRLAQPAGSAGDDGEFWRDVWHKSVLGLWNLNPFRALLGCEHRIDHRLHPRPIQKTWPALPLLVNGGNELKILVITERHQWIALVRIARRVGDLEELLGYWNCFQPAVALLANLQFQRAVQVIDDRRFLAIHLAIILTRAAFAAAGGEFGAFEISGGTGFKIGQDGHPVFDIGRLAAALVDESAGVAPHARPRGPNQVARIENVREDIAPLTPG